MTREKSVAVSETEQERLDDAAESLFGTENVPYGAVISGLIEQYENGAQNDN